MLNNVKHYLVPYRIQKSPHLPPALIGSLMYRTKWPSGLNFAYCITPNGHLGSKSASRLGEKQEMLKSVKHYLVPYRIQISSHLPPPLIESLMYHTNAQLCIMYYTKWPSDLKMSLSSGREARNAQKFDTLPHSV